MAFTLKNRPMFLSQPNILQDLLFITTVLVFLYVAIFSDTLDIR